jgi:CRP-like cAMP-binding protein
MDEPSGFPSFLDENRTSKARLTALQKAEFTRTVEIFSEATVEQLFQLASIAHEADFGKGQVIFREGDVADRFYVIVQGKVELASSGNGVREVVGPGRAFGLYGALAREPWQVTATALQVTFAIVIEAEDFYGLLSDNTEIVASILRFLVRKYLHPYG